MVLIVSPHRSSLSRWQARSRPPLVHIHYPDIFIQIQSVILFLHSSSRVKLSASFGARSNFLTESRVRLMDGVGRQTTGAGHHLSCKGTIGEVFTIMGLLTNTRAFSWCLDISAFTFKTLLRY